jgi:hypothetical protein
MIPLHPAIAAAVTVEAMEEAEAVVAIDRGNTAQISAALVYRNAAFLDSFQYCPGISLELLENAAFPFASRRALPYR